MTLLSYVLSTCVEYSVFLLFLSNVPKDSACRAKFTENCSFQSLSCVWFFETPWTAAHKASLPLTSSLSLRKLMSIESVMPSHQLILCHPFPSCLQPFPASGSFPVSWLLASSSQSIGASASVLPVKDWSLKSSGPYEAVLPIMLVEVMEFQLSYLKY